MSQTLGELFNKLATQAGVSAEDEGLKALLSNAALSNTEVPENISTGIQGSLLTIESAKNNPTLKNHFFAQALNGVDTELSNLYGELSLDDTVVSELNAEKSSTKRTALLVRKVKELEAAKVGQNAEGKDALQETIDSLNAQIVSEKEGYQQQIETLQQEHRNGLQSILMDNQLAGYDYSLPVEKDISIQTARQILNAELAAKGGKVVLTDNNKLELKTADGSQDFFLENEKIDYKSFVDKTLANHKLLKATNAPAPGAPAPAPGQGLAPQGSPAPAPAGSNAFLAEASKDANQFE